MDEQIDEVGSMLIGIAPLAARSIPVILSIS